MMELSHSLLLNEEALRQLPETKRPVFIFEWLRFLDKVLLTSKKVDIKECQKKMVDQLTSLIQKNPGPPTRMLIAKCLSTLFNVGDTFLLFDTVNKCNDLLRVKDDSLTYLSTKLAAVTCMGFMYKNLGRMMGRSYEETVTILIKCLKNAESQIRVEIIITLEKICCGMGNVMGHMHKDIYKAIKHSLTDRVMAVRTATAKCLFEMIKHSSFLYTSDLENVATLCFRAFENANYEVRCSVAKFLGFLIASTQIQNKELHSAQMSKSTKCITLEDSLTILMNGFLRGGTGFLKGTGEIIKGTTGSHREVRVGVTYTYVEFVHSLDVTWLEKNLNTFMRHILDLVSNPKSASSRIDAIYSRKCISFILRSVLGQMLSEKAQSSACKELALIVKKQMSSIDFSPENAKDFNQETIFGQNFLVCALQEMGCLLLNMGTMANNLISDNTCNVIETALSVMVHPSPAVRLSAAWCIRCVCIALPSQCTPLIDRCIENIESSGASPEIILGYSSVLIGILGSVKVSPLGIPHMRGKIIFNTAEDLLRTASQNSRLSHSRTKAGWLLIGGVMTLGVSVVRGLLPRMLLLWRNSFPRSSKELESEKARGDLFTWKLILEGRAGALASIYSFLFNCNELVTEEKIKRLLVPIESALAMLINMNSVVKSYGQHLKAPIELVRLRLYETLSLIPAQDFEASFTHILRLLVSEFTLAENPANTVTSKLRYVCKNEEGILLGICPVQHSHHQTIEDQVDCSRKVEYDYLIQNNAIGSGALDNDPRYLYLSVSKDDNIPSPLPLEVSVIDASVTLFGLIFPRVTNKHRIQMIDHFTDQIKYSKSCRCDAISTNIFASLLAGLKALSDTKSTIGHEEIKTTTATLITNALTNGNTILRVAAAESVGRMAQAVSDSRFTAMLAQTSFDRLRCARDVPSRTGHSLALGYLHRHVGGMGSSHHLNTSVSILLALAQDTTSPIVQVWSLHALSLIANSGGPMFRGYIEPSLSLALKLLLIVPHYHADVHQCIGKLISSLITTIGPELQGNSASITTARSSFLCACAIMQDHEDPLVQAESTVCLQELHMFTPKHVNLTALVWTLCQNLSNSHLLLRKAAVSCLRQLSQREAKEVCEIAESFVKSPENINKDGFLLTESGLPGVLFNMLDTEMDKQLIKDIHDTLISMLQMLAVDNLTKWINLCKSVLTVSSELHNKEIDKNDGPVMNDDDETGDDHDEFQKDSKNEYLLKRKRQPRWPTRVFAVQCICRIISSCHKECDSSPHFNLSLAKELSFTNNKGDYLILHLSDLIRMAFMAATSDSDQLRLEGFETLNEIIEKFAQVPEPEFPGHLLLEQFQAQVSAALRPAFSEDTPSHVTAAACRVCGTWIGSGVARDLSDLRRVYHLLVTSLKKLKPGFNINFNSLYNESVATFECLAILKAWAQIYIIAMINNGVAPDNFNKNSNLNVSETNDDFGNYEGQNDSLLTLIHPELDMLSKNWQAALKDHALLLLPCEFNSQLPHEGGAFYTSSTIDSSRSHYKNAWPPILYALSLWLNSEDFKDENTSITKELQDKFYLIFGICTEAICNQRTLENVDNFITCLKSLYTILDSPLARRMMMKNCILAVETLNIMHKLLLTNDSIEVQQTIMNIVKQIVKAAQEDLKIKNSNSANEKSLGSSTAADVACLGDGGQDGVLEHDKSIVFATLEVCMCLIVRQIPDMNPTPLVSSTRKLHSNCLNHNVIAITLNIMAQLPNLCSPSGGVQILPTIAYLITNVLKELGENNSSNETSKNKISILAALDAFHVLCKHSFGYHKVSESKWRSLLQSTIAKLIDISKTGDEGKKLNEITMLSVITVFTLHAPPGVMVVQNILYPCINYCTQCFGSDNIVVKTKCIQFLKAVFQLEDKYIATGYIQALAPRLMELLYVDIPNNMLESNLIMLCEAISAIECLVQLAQPKHRTQMLALLVPSLINFLIDTELTKYDTVMTKSRSKLHEFSLQCLLKIGPVYPQEFKIIMSQNNKLKTKLEHTIKTTKSQQQFNSGCHIPQSITKSIQPSIKLKTDFTNFS
ncbi:HEAT repeat-containing protein 5B isoform X4 [Acyrthosiphon pisum]|uniref:HEAT repeat-containing protein 5A n=1 Tax=Acyrthosiphon pisum TaxID=7029 RepID=A0A8R2FCD3_ACYPI|nr:HEAT repeat-containing protein 5B isoform X4 [Acyrthosiphon pisum]|eukprot:XP_008187609.1 PREDICTED: HEAT repeat-containing protein 5B isoform X1 [Acyrthosiphon pisum]